MSLPEEADIDLGNGVVAAYTRYSWHDRAGLIEWHRDTQTGDWCCGAVLFDLEGVHVLFPECALWTVVSFEPLTITPSILCRICGHHGWITDGRWVNA